MKKNYKKADNKKVLLTIFMLIKNKQTALKCVKTCLEFCYLKYNYKIIMIPEDNKRNLSNLTKHCKGKWIIVLEPDYDFTTSDLRELSRE